MDEKYDNPQAHVANSALEEQKMIYNLQSQRSNASGNLTKNMNEQVDKAHSMMDFMSSINILPHLSACMFGSHHPFYVM